MKAFNALIVRTLPFVPKPLVRIVSSRYVAGETLAEALPVVRELNRERCMATLDVLGEDVTRLEETEETVLEYSRALEALARDGLDSNISVKLSALGLKLDPVYCRRQLNRILEAAGRYGTFVRIDMEDSAVTEETIQTYLEARQRTEKVGLVLQAYLRRSRSDAARAIRVRANVRVCKGIYAEPPEIAYQGREEIRENFAVLVDDLLGAGCYVGIATHDEVLVARALASIGRLRLQPQAYEFQMLLGVAGDLRRRLVAAGHRLRVYVPYGRAWYGYSLRRLKENPAIAGHIVKNLFVGGRR
ncbi:MAG TPA: proline dehydrogenase family protein [Thermoanaerobaculia bacterium]|nr:proline dehydrogenase family protein [Thermoanaerobaculia bacterium]